MREREDPPEEAPQGRGKRKMILRMAAGVILGAAAGWLYWWFVGCRSGTCPITSSPFISTLYGAGMGALLAH